MKDLNSLKMHLQLQIQIYSQACVLMVCRGNPTFSSLSLRDCPLATLVIRVSGMKQNQGIEPNCE